MPTPRPVLDVTEKELQVVIGGSLQKYLAEIQAIYTIFRLLQACITAPASIIPVGAGSFVRLEGDDPTKSNVAVEAGYMRKLLHADVFYVVNRDNYIGMSAAAEIMLALARGIPVVTAYPAERFGKGVPYSVALLIRKHVQVLIPSYALPEKLEPALKTYKKPELTKEELLVMKDIVRELLRELAALDTYENTYLQHPEAMTLGNIQDYVDKVTTIRGFDNESLLTKLSILGGEVGELLVSCRKLVGGKASLDARYKDIGHGLADCLFVLTDIASAHNVKLKDTLRHALDGGKKNSSPSLISSQEAVALKAGKMQLDIESLEEKTLALLISVGNLGKASRKAFGSHNSLIKKTLEKPIGRLLFTILDIANTLGLHMAEEFQAMEAHNRLRTWE